MPTLRLLLLTACTLLFLVGIATAAIAPQPGDFHGRPPQGQGGDPDLNRLKNRSDQVATPQTMTVAKINTLPLLLETRGAKRRT